VAPSAPTCFAHIAASATTTAKVIQRNIVILAKGVRSLFSLYAR
jgi:hypothetical protein